LGASEHLAQPSFPESFSCPSTIIPANRGQIPSHFFRSLQSSVVFKDLLSVLQNMSLICVALERPEACESNSSAFNDLIRTRNTVQHRLLSLPRRDFILIVDHAVFEACRLAAMIFSDLVIFPLPSATKVRSRLAGMLRRTLERIAIDYKRNVHGQVLLWTVVVGAAAASDLEEHQSWYRSTLRQYCDTLEVQEWQDLHSIMKRHLWFGQVCNIPAQRLWSQAIGRG
jgi:hypothetical protein